MKDVDKTERESLMNFVPVVHSWNSVIFGIKNEDLVDLYRGNEKDTPASLIFSSGSTGVPKATIITDSGFNNVRFVICTKTLVALTHFLIKTLVAPTHFLIL